MADVDLKLRIKRQDGWLVLLLALGVSVVSGVLLISWPMALGCHLAAAIFLIAGVLRLLRRDQGPAIGESP